MIEFTSYASGSSGNFYTLTDGDAILAIECGIRFSEIQKALKFRVSELSGVLVTHSHQDHCKGIKDLMKAGVDCFLSLGAAKQIGVDGHHRFRRIEAQKEAMVGPFRVLPFDLIHDVSEPLGFMVEGPSGERLLFITDTAWSPYRFPPCHIIAAEANWGEAEMRENSRSGKMHGSRFNRTASNHMPIERLERMLLKNDLSECKEIHLLHLSDENSNAAEFKRRIQALTGIPTYIAAKNAREVPAI